MSETVYDPNRRQHYRFSRDGDSLTVDIEVAPGGDGPPHYHPMVEERWTVVEGEVRFKVDGKKVIPPPGEEIVVAPGIRHSFRNVGAGDARIRAVCTPASSMQEFLEDAAELARAGYYTRHGVVKGPRGAMKMAEFIERYRDVAVILWPPRFVQRMLVGMRRLAPGGG